MTSREVLTDACVRLCNSHEFTLVIPKKIILYFRAFIINILKCSQYLAQCPLASITKWSSKLLKCYTNFTICESIYIIYIKRYICLITLNSVSYTSSNISDELISL